jgi:hypothetical protein
MYIAADARSGSKRSVTLQKGDHFEPLLAGCPLVFRSDPGRRV